MLPAFSFKSFLVHKICSKWQILFLQIVKAINPLRGYGYFFPFRLDLRVGRGEVFHTQRLRATQVSIIIYPILCIIIQIYTTDLISCITKPCEVQWDLWLMQYHVYNISLSTCIYVTCVWWPQAASNGVEWHGMDGWTQLINWGVSFSVWEMRNPIFSNGVLFLMTFPNTPARKINTFLHLWKND